jgi:hypothetical protein
MLAHANTEVVMLNQFVSNDEMGAWINYTKQHHEASVKEGHMLQKGNLNRLVNTSNFHPYMTQMLPNGQIAPDDIARDWYLAAWSYSPPPSSYGQINWNVMTVEDHRNAVEAAITLENETLFSKVRPYTLAPGLAFTIEEHNAMHSTRAGSQTSHPHCFVFQPVHKMLRDPSSEIVGVLIGGHALDASLRHLLPEGVSITTVIKNNCNQSFTYEIE